MVFERIREDQVDFGNNTLILVLGGGVMEYGHANEELWNLANLESESIWSSCVLRVFLDMCPSLDTK